MDNPFSWFMVIVFARIIIYYICVQASLEKEHYKKENEKFFRGHF